MSKKTMVAGALSLLVLGAAVIGANTYADEKKTAGPNYSPERHENMQKAFADKDYAAWKELMAGRGAAGKITEENFERFSEMHKLRQEGKIAEADAIRQELGLGQGFGRGKGGRGQNRHGNFIDENKDGVCDRMQ